MAATDTLDAIPASPAPGSIQTNYADRALLPPSARPAGGGANVVPFPHQENSRAAIQRAIAEEWSAAGYPAPTVNAIVRRVGVESGFDPFAIGDNHSSLSLYQHHADRAQKLAQYLQQNGANERDPVGTARLATRFAISEMNGGDPIAAKARARLMDPNISEPAAYGLFTSAFERPAGAAGSEETNLRGAAFGSFSPQAQRLVDAWTQRTDAAGEQYRAALKRSESLDDFARTAVSKWMHESDKPPQNMREAWGQWSGVAIALAALAPAFGRRNMTAALGAAGAMLQSANAADVKTYDTAYKHWKDHLDEGLKAVELLHGEAKDITNNARLSYDQQLAQLDTLSKAYGLAERLDHAGVSALEDHLRVAKAQKELIEGQNTDAAVRERDAAWLKDHPEAGGKVPADVHVRNVGEVAREVKGVAPPGQAFLDDDTAAFMARQYLAGDKSVLTGLGYGNVGAANRAKVRSAIKTIGEQQGLSPEEITIRQAEFAGTVAGERTLGTLTATTEKFTQEATQMAELVVRASEAFPRSEFPSINSVFNRVREGTGDTRIVRLNAAINSFINVYAKAVNPQGAATVSDKEHAREMLSSAQTPEQVVAVIDQLKQEMAAARASLPAVRQEFRGGASTRTTPPASSPPAPSQGAGVAVPAEHAADPDGTRYQGSDGRVYVKSGNQMVPQ